jgi:hypothetical protein
MHRKDKLPFWFWFLSLLRSLPFLIRQRGLSEVSRTGLAQAHAFFLARDFRKTPLHSVNLRSFRLFCDFGWHCKPKQVCKIGDSCTPPAASDAGEISGHCLSNLVIGRRQYGKGGCSRFPYIKTNHQ